MKKRAPSRGRTPQWVKKLGGHAGELYVAAELSKRGIPNALLPENFSDHDIMGGAEESSGIFFIQVKSCHPDRSKSFILREGNEAWTDAPSNQFVVFVWLGSPGQNEPPRYWVARKSDVGRACGEHRASGTSNWERRFYPKDFPAEWENAWRLFQPYLSKIERCRRSLRSL